MLLSFPNLHPELWAARPLDGLRFFDPGLTEKAVEGGYRPGDLPLDAKAATALINDCINFGEQFKDPSEMAYFGAHTADDFYEGSPNSIRAQLERQFADGQGGKEERERQEARSKAQFILLLAWFLEERLMELDNLEKGVRNSWKAMDRTIGVDDDDRLDERVVGLGSAQSHTGGVSDGQSIPLPWKRVIEALPAFIPEDSVLVCADNDIIEAWEEQGIEFVNGKHGLMTATLPAWKFACRRSAPGDMPPALREVTVAIIK